MEEKKTQIGQGALRSDPPASAPRPTPSPSVAVAAAISAPPRASEPPADPRAKTSYLPQGPDPLLGQHIADRYVIEKKLGEGGMGAVYLATHTVLEKQVALKILHGEFARKPDLVTRFMQEAKAASRIGHENVIDISDFGATPDGLVFFAMEKLDGHDLHDEVSRARVTGHLLPWSRTKKIFLQICAALSAAHAKGVVHRDLKPENIYLVDFLGDPDFVKLLDFGIAKLTDTADEGGRKLTKTGMLFGTPEYMSPEQARGENVDHRVDIYAMGCILFQLVTNRVPFESDNFMGVLSMHLTEPPPSIPPEVFDQIGAPRAIAEVIDRALAKDRNVRYQTIEDLANAVRDVCGDPRPITGAMRAATPAPSVQAPSQTIQRRAQTPQPQTAPPGTPQTAPPGTDASGRVRTQWTGTLSVPSETVEVQPAAKKSKAPLVIGGLIIVGGAIAAVAILGMSKSAPAPAPAPGAPGSAVAQQTQPAPAPSPAPAPTPAPQVAPVPPAPTMVSLHLDSSPQGATVTDAQTNALVGKTPCTATMPGAHATRQFRFQLRGYGDAIVELPLDHESLDYKVPLTKGATAATVVRTPVPPIVTTPGTNANPQLKTDPTATATTTPGAVTRPDQTAANPPPTPTTPVNPTPTPPTPPKNPDDITPTLKTPFPAGGSGS